MMVHSMPSFWRECQMSTLCTAFLSFPREGDTPLNTLKNCAKTTAKINMQKIIPIDELRPSWKSHLEFYAWLMLRFRVLFDQQLNQRLKQGFASFPNIMDKLEETEIEREFLL